MVNVKNTIIDSLLGIVAPHLCYGCGKMGTLLCDHCKYGIISRPFAGCILCGQAAISGVCPDHKVAYSQTWVVGMRSGVLQRLIGSFKFQNVKAASRPLATLLHERLPSLSPRTVVVPVPTAPSHIRERGYDHVLLIAQHFAHLRSVALDTQLIGRRHSKTQHGANREARITQAISAFHLKGKVSPGAHYVIIDDVMTTGSTIQGVARLLKRAGARSISIAVLARQPLD